jgi:hypothetical protein
MERAFALRVLCLKWGILREILPIIGPGIRKLDMRTRKETGHQMEQKLLRLPLPNLLMYEGCDFLQVMLVSEFFQ